MIVSVAPLAGARIEMEVLRIYLRESDVAPLAGARIEICMSVLLIKTTIVAPLAGARIEMMSKNDKMLDEIGRSPRGSED